MISKWLNFETAWLLLCMESLYASFCHSARTNEAFPLMAHLCTLLQTLVWLSVLCSYWEGRFSKHLLYFATLWSQLILRGITGWVRLSFHLLISQIRKVPQEDWPKISKQWNRNLNLGPCSFVKAITYIQETWGRPIVHQESEREKQGIQKQQLPKSNRNTNGEILYWGCPGSQAFTEKSSSQVLERNTAKKKEIAKGRNESLGLKTGSGWIMDNYP